MPYILGLIIASIQKHAAAETEIKKHNLYIQNGVKLLTSIRTANMMFIPL